MKSGGSQLFICVGQSEKEEGKDEEQHHKMMRNFSEMGKTLL